LGKFEIDPNSRFVIVGRKLKRLKMRIVKRRSNNIMIFMMLGKN
jgi:hypothetical protein